jgi:hypothetical protein
MALGIKALYVDFTTAMTLGTMINLTGFGFDPVSYLILWNGRTEGSDTLGLLDSRVGIGCAAGASQRGASGTFFDQGTTNCVGGSRITASGVLLTCTAAGVQDGLVDHNAFISDGIQFIIDDVLPVNIRALVIAFGGSDITNVFAGHYLVASGASGNVDFTGFGFDPGENSLCLFMGNAEMYYSSSFEQVDEDIIQIFFGAARTKPTVQQFVMCINADDDSATMDTDSYHRSGECVASISQVGAASANMRASFVQSVTGGIRLNILEAPANISGFLVLCIKGGQWHIGDLLTQTDTTTDMVENGFGFPPVGAVFASHCLAQSAADTAQAGAQFSIGACTGTADEKCMSLQDEDATGNMETEAGIEYDSVYQRISATATEDGAMAAQTFPQSDGFTMRMSNADPSQAFVSYIAGGSNPAKSLVYNPSPLQHMLVR